MAHEIAQAIRCRICGASFVKPPGFLLGGAGAPANGRLVEFARKIAKHFLENHPQENGACELQALEYLGMLRLCKFDIPDADLRQQRDFIRWKTHQATLAGRLQDEVLELRAAELAGEFGFIFAVANARDQPDEFEAKKAVLKKVAALLVEVFKGYREAVEEPGKYLPSGELAPKPGAPTPV